MRRILIFIGLIVLSSCGPKNDSNNSPKSDPPNPSKNEQPGTENTKPATPETTTDPRTCPYMEMMGTYLVTKVECAVDGQAEIAPDLNVVPMSYSISSQTDKGQLELIFHDERGVEESRIKLEFPRTPDAEDFKNNGIQCGNTSSSKALTQGCPGQPESCAYSVSEEQGKYIGVYYLLKERKLLACRSELIRAAR